VRLLGAHLSTAGGIENALVQAGAWGFTAVALFLRNQRQWDAPPLTEATVRRFRALRRRHGIGAVVAHASYLVNLAADEPHRARSEASLVDDLTRCGRLGCEGLVVHPGAHPDRDLGLARIAESLDRILTACPARRPRLLLETTAGQGSSLGWRFADLAEIRRGVRRRARVGVCLDTCHVFTAGHDLRDARAYRRMMEEFDATVGLAHLHAIHVNDSLKPLGSRVDRHAHLGLGEIGLAGLRRVMRDTRLVSVPMVIETPKDLHPDGRHWDQVNVATLRELAGSPRRVGARS
jgi:deoxyribonuclease IV